MQSMRATGLGSVACMAQKCGKQVLACVQVKLGLLLLHLLPIRLSVVSTTNSKLLCGGQRRADSCHLQDPECKAALDCLNDCAPNDQVRPAASLMHRLCSSLISQPRDRS